MNDGVNLLLVCYCWCASKVRPETQMLYLMMIRVFHFFGWLCCSRYFYFVVRLRFGFKPLPLHHDCSYNEQHYHQIRKKSHYQLLPQNILNLHATKEEQYAQEVMYRKTNRPGDGHSTFRRFAVDPYGTDRGSSLELRTYLQQRIEGSALNPDSGAAPPNSSPSLLKKWQYEVVRQLIVEMNWLVAQVKQDGDPAALRNQMGVGSKFTFLCSAYRVPRLVSAENYMVHMLDQAAELLTDPKIFPPKAKTISQKGQRVMTDIVRRIYRIFPHCLYHQGPVFRAFENKRHLYARFLAFNERSNFISHQKLQPYISKNQLAKSMSR